MLSNTLMSFRFPADDVDNLTTLAMVSVYKKVDRSKHL